MLLHKLFYAVRYTNEYHGGRHRVIRQGLDGIRERSPSLLREAIEFVDDNDRVLSRLANHIDDAPYLRDAPCEEGLRVDRSVRREHPSGLKRERLPALLVLGVHIGLVRDNIAVAAAAPWTRSVTSAPSARRPCRCRISAPWCRKYALAYAASACNLCRVRFAACAFAWLETC